MGLFERGADPLSANLNGKHDDQPLDKMLGKIVAGLKATKQRGGSGCVFTLSPPAGLQNWPWHIKPKKRSSETFPQFPC